MSTYDSFDELIIQTNLIHFLNQLGVTGTSNNDILRAYINWAKSK